MIAFAEQEFRLGVRQPDGAETRAHMTSAVEQMRKMGMKPPAGAVTEQLPFPIELRYLWEWFCELSAGLPLNGMTYPAVAWTDVAAWSALCGVRLEIWESKLIVRLGGLRAGIQMEAMKSKNG